MMDYKSRFVLGQKVRVVGVAPDDLMYGMTGTYAGTSTPDGYLCIVILDVPIETHMAVTFPAVCLEGA